MEKMRGLDGKGMICWWHRELGLLRLRSSAWEAKLILLGFRNRGDQSCGLNYEFVCRALLGAGGARFGWIPGFLQDQAPVGAAPTEPLQEDAPAPTQGISTLWSWDLRSVGAFLLI